MVKYEVIAIDELVPNVYNPNRQSEHEFQLLLLSIKEHGFTQPILALRELDAQGCHVIVDGEHRWKAAKELGLVTVPVAFVGLDEGRRRVATMRHNLARGIHNMEIEAQLLQELKQAGIDLSAALLMDDVEIDFIEKVDGDDVMDVPLVEVEEEEGRLILAGRKDAWRVGGSELVREREQAVGDVKQREVRALRVEDSLFFSLRLIFLAEEKMLFDVVLGEDWLRGLVDLCAWAQARDLHV